MLPFISRDLALMDEISAMAREDHKSMTNVQHQIQADRSGKIWINVSNNDPRLNINGIVARIRPVYNHTVFARQNEIIVDSPSKIQQAILIALFNGKHSA